MTIHVINIFTKLLLIYRNHVIYLVLTNPFGIQGFDNVQNICWNTKGYKEDLNSTCMKILFPEVVVMEVENLVYCPSNHLEHRTAYWAQHQERE